MCCLFLVSFHIFNFAAVALPQYLMVGFTNIFRQKCVATRKLKKIEKCWCKALNLVALPQQEDSCITYSHV